MTKQEILDNLKGQQWYQEIIELWNQLDEEQQKIARIVLVALLVLTVLGGLLIMRSSVNDLKEQMSASDQLIDLMQKSSEENRRSRSSMATRPGAPGWKSVVTGILDTQGVPQESLEVMDEHPAANSVVGSDMQETLASFRIKGVGMNAMTQILNALEAPGTPIKIRALDIETSPDGNSLILKFAISAFQPKPETKPKGGA